MKYKKLACEFSEAGEAEGTLIKIVPVCLQLNKTCQSSLLSRLGSRYVPLCTIYFPSPVFFLVTYLRNAV